MAQSRLDRIGTIYSRVRALIQGGSMKENNIPIWYTIYEAFPPKYEPRYDRPPSDKPLRKIFYEEDYIRAQFHQDINFLPSIDLTSKLKSPTQSFLDVYTAYRKDSIEKTEAYNRAMEYYQSNFSTRIGKKLDS
ncbi:mitochondrial ribosomal protein S23 [Calliopsis andreniformis]|uniref:mitochondrial ribosomal protein S23 n=1 Tax=Calliopsis andreniformis TaxID=337506 RepID=UPI003FCE419B